MARTRTKAASKRELEAFDLTDIEIESFLKDGTTLEDVVRTARETRLFTRLRADYPCGKCLKKLGENNYGFTWNIHTMTWVHRTCSTRRTGKTKA